MALTLVLLSTSDTAPSTVCNLQLHSPGSPSSLKASWGAASGERDGYQLLLYHLESQTLVRNISMPPGTPSYNFSNLLPGSEYVLEVTTWAGNLQAKTSIRQWTGKAGTRQGPGGSWSGSGGGRPEPHRPPGPHIAGGCQDPTPGLFLKPGFALSVLLPAPLSPPELVLRTLSTRALQASWNGSEGAAWLHLVLTDLLGGTNLTSVVRRGVSNHTFFHLSPGTPYELTLSAVAGPQQVAGPSATQWTCECLGGTQQRLLGSSLAEWAGYNWWRGVPLESCREGVRLGGSTPPAGQWWDPPEEARVVSSLSSLEASTWQPRGWALAEVRLVWSSNQWSPVTPSVW